MVQVPQVTIPDFGASIARGQAVQQSRLQSLIAQQGLDEAQRFNAALPGLSGALATGQGPEYDSALASLAGSGRRGLEMALPMMQAQRNRREARSFDWDGTGGQAPAGGTTPAVAQPGDYTARMVSMESGGDPNARNPRSSATGDGQFIAGTWMQFARANPQLFQGMTPQQILDARTNPDLSRQAIDWYRRENLSQLSGQGLPANDGTAALAHRFGPQGATALLRADPNAPIDGVVGPQVMQANPDLAGRTVGQVVGNYAQRFGGDTTPASGPVQPGQPAPQQPPGGMTPAMAARLEAALNSGNPELVAAARNRMALMGLQRRDTTDRFQPATENIGGRQVQGQRNTRTGQFTPYPGQSGAEQTGLSSAQANGIVARLGPRIARGEITPDSQEYDEYSAAYAIATRPQNVWTDDPSNPGTQRMQQVPGVVFDPARFPPPSGGSYQQATPGPVSPQATPGGVPIGATGATAESPNDAVVINPGGVSRPSPNSTPSGEENQTAGYARRMVEAESLLRQAVGRGYVPGNLRDSAATAAVTSQNAGAIQRYAGNAAMSAEGQLYRQAQEDWVRAKLRRESGAVIGAQEMADEIRLYFPQAGDGDAVIAQKAESRRVAMEAMRQGAGRAGAAVPREATPPQAAHRRRAEDALARARRELGAGATDDAIVERARGYMQ